ncbi:hypothetical protein, partial [Agrobacterium tumefaciens]|uniref:hypothetical protein n=1 Tax=Agrobacterium tumefaciens TaxID=358 RepID=UPI001AED3006
MERASLMELWGCSNLHEFPGQKVKPTPRHKVGHLTQRPEASKGARRTAVKKQDPVKTGRNTSILPTRIGLRPTFKGREDLSDTPATRCFSRGPLLYQGKDFLVDTQ